MTLPVSDDFNRADGALGADWTHSFGGAGPNIVGNTITHGDATRGGHIRNTDVFPNDGYVQATIAATGGSGQIDYMGIGYRMSASADTGVYWYRQADGNAGASVEVYNAGSRTHRTFLSDDGTAGQVVRLEVEGTDVRVYYDDVLSETISNPTGLPASGSAGVLGFRSDGGMRLDDWSAGGLGGGGDPDPVTHTEVLTSSLLVTDGDLERSRHMTVSSEVEVDDTAARLFRLARLLEDTFVTNDALLRALLRCRTADSSVALVDSVTTALSTGGSLLTRILTSELLATDELLPVAVRTRLQNSALNISDGSLLSALRSRLGNSTVGMMDDIAAFSTRNRVAESPLTVVDELALFALRYRLAASNIELNDALMSQTSTGNVIARVLSSEIVMLDDLLRALLLAREMTSLLSTDDDVLRIRTWMKLVDDEAAIVDSFISASSVDAMPNPVFIVGTDRTVGFELGSEPSQHLTLGGYSL